MSIQCKRSMKILTIIGAVGICLIALAALGITVVMAVAAIGARSAELLIPWAISVPVIAIAILTLRFYLRFVLRVDIDANRVEYYTLLHRISAAQEQVRVAKRGSRLIVGMRGRNGRAWTLQIPFFKHGDIALLKRHLL